MDSGFQGKRNCLRHHWGVDGTLMYSHYKSHCKVAVSSNTWGGSIESVSEGEFLNSIPDVHGQEHDFEYFVEGGLTGGFINAADSHMHENVQWRKILNPSRCDHRGCSRSVSQVCFAIRDIEEGDEILYVYQYSKDPGVGVWFCGIEGCWPLQASRRMRSMDDYLNHLRKRREEQGQDYPNKSKDGASMIGRPLSDVCVYCQSREGNTV
jgi:hypothetical protein